MKKRTGFVSNSSSSSFCVILKDDSTSMAGITKEQEELLFGYGFRYINESWRIALTQGSPLHETTDGFDEKEPTCMYFDVICDEQDVEEFLFENKIPFVESEEYDTRTVHYDGVHDWYDTYENAGVRFAIYGLHNEIEDKLDIERMKNARPFYRTRISDGKDITDTVFEEKDSKE